MNGNATRGILLDLIFEKKIFLESIQYLIDLPKISTQFKITFFLLVSEAITLNSHQLSCVIFSGNKFALCAYLLRNNRKHKMIALSSFFFLWFLVALQKKERKKKFCFYLLASSFSITLVKLKSIIFLIALSISIVINAD